MDDICLLTHLPAFERFQRSTHAAKASFASGISVNLEIMIAWFKRQIALFKPENYMEYSAYLRIIVDVTIVDDGEIPGAWIRNVPGYGYITGHMKIQGGNVTIGENDFIADWAEYQYEPSRMELERRAHRYYNGDVVFRDWKRAALFYSVIADHRMGGQCFYFGHGVVQNVELARIKGFDPALCDAFVPTTENDPFVMAQLRTVLCHLHSKWEEDKYLSLRLVCRDWNNTIMRNGAFWETTHVVGLMPPTVRSKHTTAAVGYAVLERLAKIRNTKVKAAVKHAKKRIDACKRELNAKRTNLAELEREQGVLKRYKRI